MIKSIKADETDWASTKRGRGKKYIQHFVGKAEERDHLEDTAVDETMEAHRVVRRRGSHILSRQSAHRWRWNCQAYAPAALYAQEDSWYPFLLEAESTPRP
jgi:hypothetical protein